MQEPRLFQSISLEIDSSLILFLQQVLDKGSRFVLFPIIGTNKEHIKVFSEVCHVCKTFSSTSVRFDGLNHCCIFMVTCGASIANVMFSLGVVMSSKESEVGYQGFV